jgi:hypothetical protein
MKLTPLAFETIMLILAAIVAIIGVSVIVLASSDSEADCIQYVYSHGEPIGCRALEKP